MVKTIGILVLVVLAGLAIVYRQREYVRDPLAKVYRDNVQQDNVEVYQNWVNDVLIQKQDSPGAFRILVQDWDQMPGTPVNLTCVRWLACLTSDDRVPKLPIAWAGKGKYNPDVTMTNREISFVDGDGSRVRVELK
jgi:hypothetical protein